MGALPPGYRYTSDSLRGATERMNTAQRRAALSCFEHWIDQVRRIAFQPAINVAYTLHQQTDEHIAQLLAKDPRAKDVQCRKGCSACCHLNVDVFPQEAQLLLAVVAEQGITIDEAKLARQAGKTLDAWRELPHEDRACVFLGADQTCQVYEHRPSACRKYLVVTDPALCDVQKNPGRQVARLFHIETEIMFSAAMTEYGVSGMAQALLTARQAPQATFRPPHPEKPAADDPGQPAGPLQQPQEQP